MSASETPPLQPPTLGAAADAARERDLLRRVLASLPVGVWLADARGHIIEQNPKAAEIWGRAPGPTEPGRYHEHYPARWVENGEPVGPMEWGLARAVARGEVSGPEAVEIETGEGERRVILNFAFPLTDDAGGPGGAVAVSVDVSDRYGAEDALRARVREMELVHRLALDVARAVEPEAIYARALDAVIEALGTERASLLLFDPDGVLRFKAWRGLSEEYRAAVEGHSPWTPDTPDPQPIVVPDVASDEELGEYREVILGEGIRALAFLPLVADGRVLGKFMAYFGEPHALTADELRLVETVASHVSLAIRRGEGETDLRASNDRLRFLASASARILASDRPRDLAGELFRDLAGLLPVDCYFNYLAEPSAEGVVGLRLDSWGGAEASDVTGMERLELGEGPCGAAAERRERVVLEELEASTDAAAETVRGLGVSAYVCHPLLIRDRLVGTLSFGSRTVTRFSPADLELLASVADQMAVAIARRMSYEAEQEARRGAEAASSAKGDFMAQMSHELRTPLNAIIGYADLITMGVPAAVPPEVLRQVERIRLSARHQQQLIEEILTFSRLEAGEEAVQIDDVATGDLLDEIRAIIEPLASHKGLDFRVEAAEGAPRLRTDPRKLRQVLLNLLGNAVKFTDSGEVVLRLSAPDGDGSIAFEVRDTGVGIAAGDLDKLYEPFWRGEDTEVRLAEGSGLGLTITQRLMKLLRGTIEARSEVGVGSVFTVRLPGADARAG